MASVWDVTMASFLCKVAFCSTQKQNNACSTGMHPRNHSKCRHSGFLEGDGSIGKYLLKPSERKAILSSYNRIERKITTILLYAGSSRDSLLFKKEGR